MNVGCDHNNPVIAVILLKFPTRIFSIRTFSKGDSGFQSHLITNIKFSFYFSGVIEVLVEMEHIGTKFWVELWEKMTSDSWAGKDFLSHLVLQLFFYKSVPEARRFELFII